jgi:hypothetical protein
MIGSSTNGERTSRARTRMPRIRARMRDSFGYYGPGGNGTNISETGSPVRALSPCVIPFGTEVVPDAVTTRVTQSTEVSPLGGFSRGGELRPVDTSPQVTIPRGYCFDDLKHTDRYVGSCQITLSSSPVMPVKFGGERKICTESLRNRDPKACTKYLRL